MSILNQTRGRVLNGLRAAKLDIPIFIVWQRIRNVTYHRRSIDLYRQFIRPGDLVFDIGANMGERTKTFLALGAKVIAVEPQPLCLQKLRSLFEGNPNVTIVEKAVGDHLGTAELSICDGDSGISTLSEKWKQMDRYSGIHWTKTCTVELTTLDALVKKYGQPAYCKVDVEGFEVFVLKGLTRPIRYVSFEFMREFLDDTQKCMEHLSSLGKVEFNYSRSESLKLRNRTWKPAADAIRELKSDQEKLFWGDIFARSPL